jgi:hypothetical protein
MSGLIHQAVSAVVDLLGWLVWVVALVRVNVWALPVRINIRTRPLGGRP